LIVAVIRVSPAALADIEEIMDYLIAVAGQALAAKYEHDFNALFERIAAHPGIGAPRPKLGRNVRIMTVTPFSIYYDGAPTSDLAAILRVVRGRRRVHGD
jgi:toxin ParE1/3/4